MDFAQFTKEKSSLLASGDILDASETRVVKALGSLRTPVEQLELPPKAHRCHLAEFWLDFFGFDRSMKRRTLISKGVRHSLSLLLGQWAKDGKRLLLPADVYPVYLELSQAGGIEHSTYDIWPKANWALTDKVDVLLVTNPAKPRGGVLSKVELDEICAWLSGDANRRVVVDAVYSLTAPLDNAVERLLATGQAILLHSLSKAWLQPLVMGVAVVPESDVELYTAAFRAEPPEQDHLRLAQALLTHDMEFPQRLSEALASKRLTLQQRLKERGLEAALEAPVPGYLFVLPISAEALFQKHKVLALPFTVFGQRNEDHCVVSSLEF